MKLFWKIYFSIMLVCVLCFALGGYVLIRFSFSAQFSQELDAAYNQNEIVAYALAGELTEEVTEELGDVSGDMLASFLTLTARGIDISQSGVELKFSLFDGNKKELFSSSSDDVSAALLESASEGRRGNVTTVLSGRYLLQTVSPLSVAGETCYIVTQRDMTMIFQNQSQQIRLLMAVMCGMLLISGIMTYAVIHPPLRRISRLTKAAEAIAGGDMGQRVDISGSDEIAALSKNFNSMASELEDKIAELRESAESRERFVSAFAHELKTPLTSIIGYSDLLRGKTPPPERVRSCADYIYSEGKRLETLSMRLLELMVVKRQKLALQELDPYELLEEIRVAATPQAELDGIELIWDVEHGSAVMEPGLMASVFINLLDNARKAIDGEGKIRVEGRQTSAGYVVSIRDSGRGMSSEELVHVKEAFYMADKSRSRRQGGAGLGLAICDEILTLHGFGISFESEPGRGTQVTVSMKGGASDGLV